MSTTEELAKTYSGIFGDQVVLKKGGKGKSVMSMAKARSNGAPSEKQIAQRERLSLAAKYARGAMQDPELCEMYTKLSRKGLPPYRVASNDFLQMPFIRGIDASGYQGNPGDVIMVSAGDKIALTSVKAKLSAPDGTLLEEGMCTIDVPTGKYVYTATCRAITIAGMSVYIAVRDIPGNLTEKSFTL